MPHEGHYCCLLVGFSFPLSRGRSEEGSGGEGILLDPMLWLSNELSIDFQKGGATRHEEIYRLRHFVQRF